MAKDYQLYQTQAVQSVATYAINSFADRLDYNQIIYNAGLCNRHPNCGILLNIQGQKGRCIG